MPGEQPSEEIATKAVVGDRRCFVREHKGHRLGSELGGWQRARIVGVSPSDYRRSFGVREKLLG
jgi:hypothetical protein